MFIWKDTLKRCNPYTPYTDKQGTQYPQVPMELLTEIPDPVRMPDETHYNQEIDDAPYLICTPKPPEMLAAQQARKDKQNAEAHLASTDYLFNVDRHETLSKEEPGREKELRQSRESARAVLRQYKKDYPDAR